MKTSSNQFIQPITSKTNTQNHLEIGGCDLTQLAKEYNTPLYIIDELTLRTICKEFTEAFESYENVQFLYASKALCTKSISKIVEEEGFWFDAVSEGEIYTILSSGISAEKISFNGNNKSYDELEYAVKSGVGHFSVDNLLELKMLNEIAKQHNKQVSIFLRINPNIECHTHEYIQTGQQDSKFGFPLSDVESLVSLILSEYKNLDLKGLHSHVGSQIFELKTFEDEVEILINEYSKIKEKFNLELEELNLGGGFGVKYTETDNPPSVFEAGKIILTALEKSLEKHNVKRPKLFLEPGRSVISTSGVTIYTVGNIKEIPDIRTYVAVDGGMADNIRTALYGAKYSAVLANKMNSNLPQQNVRIVGKFCESGDILINEIELPKPETGDVLCVFNTGAYNYSMSSNYNRIKKPAMILVNSGQSDMIVKRETLEDITNFDLLPKRLEN